MEAAGVATAAFQSVDKPGFFMVRSASDLADEQKNSADVQKWRSYASDAAAAFTIALLRSGPIPVLERKTNIVAIQGQSDYKRDFLELPQKPIGIPDYKLSELGLNEQSRRNISELLGQISKNECCAFIGAELSKPAGYPTWFEFLEILKTETEYWSGITIDDEHLDNYERAEEYRNKLGIENYRNIIQREFDPDNNKQPWLSVHRDLVSMPFASWVTTNYDCILENAIRAIDGDPVYSFTPNHPITKLRNRQIFHIHGIIDHSNLFETQDSIILTRTDFDRAYTPESNLVKLITCLYTELTIFFVGFNVRDPFLMRILKISFSDLGKTQQFVSERGIGLIKNKKHYALLPYHKKISADDLYDRRTYHEENDIDATNFEDEELKLMGVRTIRYTSDMYNHTQLINIIHNYLYLPIRAKENPTSYDLTFRGE